MYQRFTRFSSVDKLIIIDNYAQNINVIYIRDERTNTLNHQ